MATYDREELRRCSQGRLIIIAQMKRLDPPASAPKAQLIQAILDKQRSDGFIDVLES